MHVAGKRSGITRADLLGVAQTFVVKNAAGSIARIEEVLGDWPWFAQETGGVWSCDPGKGGS